MLFLSEQPLTALQPKAVFAPCFLPYVLEESLVLAITIAEPPNTENWSLSFSCKFFRQISLFIQLMIWQLILREGTLWSEHRGRAELLHLAEAHIRTGLNGWSNGSLTNLFCHHSLAFIYHKPHSSGWVPKDFTLFYYSCFPNFPGQVNNQVVWKSILDLERVLEWRVLGELK